MLFPLLEQMKTKSPGSPTAEELQPVWPAENSLDPMSPVSPKSSGSDDTDWVVVPSSSYAGEFIQYWIVNSRVISLVTFLTIFIY